MPREVAALLRTKYKDATNVMLVCDNLSAQTTGALYEVLLADEARALAKRWEFRDKPKHVSCWNIAESESSALTRQCVGRCRFETVEELRAEAAW